MLCLCEGRKWLGEELVAKGDDLFLAHGGQCHRLLRKAELFTKDFEQPCLFEPVEQRRVWRPMRANVRHHLDLEVMHQAVALSAAGKTGLRRAGRGIGDQFGLLARLKGAERRKLICRRLRLIRPGQIERVMRLGHLFQRCAIDLVHLGVAAVFLAGLDLDGVGCAHAAKHVRDQLEQVSDRA